MNITVLYHASDAAFAKQVSDALTADGHTVFETVQQGIEPITLIVLSEAVTADDGLMNKLFDAMDLGQRVISVAAKPVTVPEEIDHVMPVDMTAGFDAALLRARVTEEGNNQRRYPLRVRTPSVKADNRRWGIIVGGSVALLFAFFIWAIIMFDIESPADEYAAVDTQVALTRDFLIEPTMQYLATFLPRSTEQAENFQPTLKAIGTRVRPFLAYTATAIYDDLSTVFPVEQVADATATPAP